LFFINKMDRDRADFQMALAGIRDKLAGHSPTCGDPIAKRKISRRGETSSKTRPIFSTRRARHRGPDPRGHGRRGGGALRDTTVEEIAVSDEELMERYLEGGELSMDEMRAAVRKAVACGQPLSRVRGLGSSGHGRRTAAGRRGERLPRPPGLLRGRKDRDRRGRNRAQGRPGRARGRLRVQDPLRSLRRAVVHGPGAHRQPGPGRRAFERGQGRQGTGRTILLPLGKGPPFPRAVGPGAIVALAMLKDTGRGDTLSDEKKPFVLAKPALPAAMSPSPGPGEKGDGTRCSRHGQASGRGRDPVLSRDEDDRGHLISGMGSTTWRRGGKGRRRLKVETV
jgi:elongation factor G